MEVLLLDIVPFSLSEKEKAKINEKALMLIAKASEGSVRDALSILDQAISTFNILGEEIIETSVRTMLGIADRSRIIDLVRFVIDGDKAKALADVQEIVWTYRSPREI